MMILWRSLLIVIKAFYTHTYTHTHTHSPLVVIKEKGGGGGPILCIEREIRCDLANGSLAWRSGVGIIRNREMRVSWRERQDGTQCNDGVK